MTLLPLISHVLELEKRHQISILLAPCISQGNIFLVLGVSLMRRSFNASYINSLCGTNFEGYMNSLCGTEGVLPNISLVPKKPLNNLF
jgi:hypothetical protein